MLYYLTPVRARARHARRARAELESGEAAHGRQPMMRTRGGSGAVGSGGSCVRQARASRRQPPSGRRASPVHRRSRRRCSMPSFPACPIRWSCSITTAACCRSTPQPWRSRRRCDAASRPRSRSGCPNWSRRSGRAAATGKAQRIEFSARVPLTRWSEAFVSPIALDGRQATAPA